MLVLSRNPGQSVVIGEGPGASLVTVIEVRGDKVRLGFTARQDVPVHRLEVYTAIHGTTPQPSRKGA